MNIDDAISAIKHAILNKTDVTDAFKQLGIRRDQHHLFCMKWKGLYYYYVRLIWGPAVSALPRHPFVGIISDFSIINSKFEVMMKLRSQHS